MFGIVGDAASYTEEGLKGFLEYLSTLDLVGDAATLAAEKAGNLSSSFYTLQDVTSGIDKDLQKAIDTTDDLFESLIMLGMTDIEKSTYDLDKFFKKVDSFGFSLTPEDLGVAGFELALFEEGHISLAQMGLDIKDLGFTSDMTSNEIIEFTQSLRDAGINLDDSIGSIYDFANAVLQTENDLRSASDVIIDSVYNLIDSFVDASNTINGIISSSTESWLLDTYTDDQKYNYHRDSANANYELIKTSLDPAEITSLVGSIVDSGNILWGLLDDTGKSINLQGFIDYVENVQDLADERIEAIIGDLETGVQGIVDDLGLDELSSDLDSNFGVQDPPDPIDEIDFKVIELASADQKVAAETMKIASNAIKKAADTINVAANTSLVAARTEKQVSVSVNIERDEVGY